MFKSKLYVIAVSLLVLSAFLVDEVEGRRKILVGRKTINRTYYRQAAIPAWAIVTIVGIIELVLGVVLYVVLNKFYIGDLMDAQKTRYSPVRANKQYAA